MPVEIAKSKSSIKSQYLDWLLRVEYHKANFWKETSIYDPIQVSKHNLLYNIPQILSSVYFWNPLMSSFHFPYGMLIVTLLDVAAIVGLKPTVSS